MTNRRALIAGNWKMNLGPDDATALASAIAGAESVAARLALFPPYPWIGIVKPTLKGADIALGAQDCHAALSGAHTGDVSAGMLAQAGCDMVIVGHSERRADHGESDQTVKSKAEAARAAGLTPIICVGETLDQRESGAALSVVSAQVNGSLPDGVVADDLVIAYEPVWAIGTGKVPTIADIIEMHAEISKTTSQRLGGVAPQILYGGSVKPDNAAEILACDGVGGALVGGASLTADAFLAIARAAPSR